MEGNQLESVTTVADNKVSADVSTDAKVINGSEAQKKSKSKSKKKDKRSGQSDEIAHTEDPNETVLKEENIVLSTKEKTSEEKKDSKKRKRTISEENGQEVADVKADEENKRRKVENTNASKDGNIENTGEKSSVQRSQKKQQKESVEVCFN